MLTGMVQNAFPSVQRGEPLDLVARQIARNRNGAEAEKRYRDDRDDEFAKRTEIQGGRVTTGNELLNAKIAALEGNALGPQEVAERRARRRLPPVLAVIGLGARSVACARSLPQRDAAEHDRPRPGPVGACLDSELADHIRQQIAAKKLWARLRGFGSRRVRR